MTPPYIKSVLDRHAEDAAILFLARDRAVGEPHYKLHQLAELDERVEAHTDGLRVAGDPGWDIALAAMEEGSASEVFPAAVLAFESANAPMIPVVLNGAKVPPKARALVSALGWLPAENAIQHIRQLLSSEEPVVRLIGIAAAAAHRLKLHAEPLLGAFASEDPLLKARALKAVGELGLVDLQHAVRANLKAKDPTCCFWAAWSTTLLTGSPDAVAALHRIAEAGGRFGERAAQMAMRRLPLKDARTWLVRLVKELGQVRIALIAAGALGDPEAIPFLIEQMKVPAMARVAGESFSFITGADLGRDKLEGQRPEGFESGPTDNPEDEDVAMDPDENLPWPDPALVRKWWQGRRGGFATGTRYLLGRPITEESVREALRTGYQRQRAAAALELAILNPGRPLFEVRAPGFRQQRLLG